MCIRTYLKGTRLDKNTNPLTIAKKSAIKNKVSSMDMLFEIIKLPSVKMDRTKIVKIKLLNKKTES